jgi:hypothetical protein
MTVLALGILAVSVVVLRTQALGRWMAFVGLGCGGVMLAAGLAQYGAFATPLGSCGGSASRSRSGGSLRSEAVFR